MSAGDSGRLPMPPSPDDRKTRTVLAAASFIVVLDYAGVVILLPSILNDLGGGLDSITWVLAGLLLPMVVLLLPAHRITDRIAPAAVMVGGLSLFAIGSLAAAFAPTIGLLIGARAVQGCAAACSEAGTVASIQNLAPNQQGQAGQSRKAAFFVAAALGPVLPGLVATAASWQLFFLMNAAAALVVSAAIVFGYVRVARSAAGRPRAFDLMGVATGGVGLTLLFVALIEGPRFGWDAKPTTGALLGAAVAMAAFIGVERRSPDPLVQLRLFADRNFRVGNVLRGATEFASLAIFLPLSHFLQASLGYSALVAGLVLTAVIVGALVSAPLAERLAPRVDVRLVIVPAFVVVALGTLWLASLSPVTTWTFFIAPLALVGIGIGALEGPAEEAAARYVPPALSAAAEEASYVIYLLGIGLGVAVVSAVWQSTIIPLGHAEAVSRALLACATVAVVGAGIGAFLTPNRALSRN